MLRLVSSERHMIKCARWKLYMSGAYRFFCSAGWHPSCIYICMHIIFTGPNTIHRDMRENTFHMWKTFCSAVFFFFHTQFASGATAGGQGRMASDSRKKNRNLYASTSRRYAKLWNHLFAYVQHNLTWESRRFCTNDSAAKFGPAAGASQRKCDKKLKLKTKQEEWRKGPSCEGAYVIGGRREAVRVRARIFNFFACSTYWQIS